MSITITDPALLAYITQAKGVIHVTDADGQEVARLRVETAAEQLARYKCPYTPEQLAELGKQRTGRPVGDVLKDLKEKYGE